MDEKVKEISVFVDESGTFDPDVEASRFYLVCMVFHDQANSIEDCIQKLNNALAELGLQEDHAVHAGPLVRWESPYRNFEGPKRRTIFSRMMTFIRRSEITYRCFCVDKRTVDDYEGLRKRLLREITTFLTAKMEDLIAYDKLKIYYDNGHCCYFSSRTSSRPCSEGPQRTRARAESYRNGDARRGMQGPHPLVALMEDPRSS